MSLAAGELAGALLAGADGAGLEGCGALVEGWLVVGADDVVGADVLEGDGLLVELLVAGLLDVVLGAVDLDVVVLGVVFLEVFAGAFEVAGADVREGCVGWLVGAGASEVACDGGTVTVWVGRSLSDGNVEMEVLDEDFDDLELLEELLFVDDDVVLLELVEDGEAAGLGSSPRSKSLAKSVDTTRAPAPRMEARTTPIIAR